MQGKDQTSRNRVALTNVISFSGGLAYRLDLAVERFDAGDMSEALAHEFEFLANQGLFEANFFLGCMIEDGSNGYQKDARKALENYEIAASEIGYIEAKLAAAKLLLNECKSPESAPRAAEMYRLLTERTNSLVAQFRLGSLFEMGLGVTKDPVRARALYARAADAGSLYGMLFLAHMDFADARYLHWLKWRAKALLTAVRFSRVKPTHEMLRPW